MLRVSQAGNQTSGCSKQTGAPMWTGAIGRDGEGGKGGRGGKRGGEGRAGHRRRNIPNRPIPSFEILDS